MEERIRIMLVDDHPLYRKENERKERTKENKEKEENKNKKIKGGFSKKKNEIPTLEEVLEYGRKLNATDEKLTLFFNIYDSVGWVTEKNIPIKKWWKRLELWLNDKGKDNVTNKNQQRQAAGAGAQAGQAGDAEEHRQEDMERHLANHHLGDDRLARLAREINQVAQEMGVPTTEYSLRQIAYDAQSLLYRMAFCEGWTDEKWQAAMAHVKAHIKGKKLNTDVLIGEVFEWSKGFKL